MEKSSLIVRQDTVAKDIQYGFLDVAEVIAGLNANGDFNFERNIQRGINFKILARHAESFEASAQLLFKVRVHVCAAKAIDGYKHRVPAAGPARRRGGPLDINAAAVCEFLSDRDLLVVGRRNGALLKAKSAGSILPDLFDRLRLDGAFRTKWISHCDDGRCIRDR